MNWLYTWAGLSNAGGAQYLFWSGIVGDFGLFGIFALAYKKLNCHVDGCRRIGLHHVEGTPYITCRTHHPTVPKDKVSAEHIHSEHYFKNGDINEKANQD